MIAALARLKPPRFTLDGELVIPVAESLSFEALQMRLHPAASRIRRLAAETPSLLIAFDLLEDEGARSENADAVPSPRRARTLLREARHEPSAAAVTEDDAPRRGAQVS